MEPASSAEIFTHVRIVMGMVVGLGTTRLLMGVAGLVQHPRRAKLSAIHLLWALSVLIELALFWWWEFELRSLPRWSFGVFAFLVSYSVTLFMLAALLFPYKIDEYDGYEDFFLQRRHWFFGVFIATDLFDIVDTLIKGEPYFDTLGLEYLVQVPIFIGLACIAIFTKDRRYHLGLVIAHLLYQLWWVIILFDTRG